MPYSARSVLSTEPPAIRKKVYTKSLGNPSFATVAYSFIQERQFTSNPLSTQQGKSKNRAVYRRRVFWLSLPLWVAIGFLAVPVVHEGLKGSPIEWFFHLPVVAHHHLCYSPCMLNVTLVMGGYDTWQWDTQLEIGQEISVNVSGEAVTSHDMAWDFCLSSGSRCLAFALSPEIQETGTYTFRVFYSNSERAETTIVIIRTH